VCPTDNNLIFWAINNTAYHGSYSLNGIHINSAVLPDGNYQSNLSITATVGISNTEISVTTYTPMAVISDTVYLNVQGNYTLNVDMMGIH
jgi:hypothetical protein